MTDYIDSDESLAVLCERASQRAFIILDTEFVRTRTLTPLLGLIQINDGERVSLIDPLAIKDFKPFVDLLLKPDCIKVLHACSEDLEAFNTAFGVMPSPLFDTQFAAQLCGLGVSLGYAKLVEDLLEVKLDKGESRTDWLARPLSDMQLTYAANDVIHLLPAYEKIMQKLSPEWVDIVFDEATLVAKKKAASMPAEYAYLLVKNNWSLNSQQRYVLKQLAAWRLRRAREKNMAINFVLRESTMLNAARILPQSKTALNKVSGITPQEIRIVGNAVISQVSSALDAYSASPEQCKVPFIKRLSEFKRYKATMSELKDCVQAIAVETGIPADILSSKKQLHQVLKYYWLEIDENRVQGLTPDLLSGWRKPLFEERIQALVN